MPTTLNNYLLNHQCNVALKYYSTASLAQRVSTIGQQALKHAEDARESQGRKALEIHRPSVHESTRSVGRQKSRSARLLGRRWT